MYSTNKEKEKERKERRKFYAIRSMADGISKLMSSNGTGPTENRIKTMLKRLKFLNDSTVKNLTKNDEIRAKKLCSKVGIFDSEKIKQTPSRRFRQFLEKSFQSNLLKYIYAHKGNKELMQGLEVMGFTSDRRIRHPEIDYELENFVRKNLKNLLL